MAFFNPANPSETARPVPLHDRPYVASDAKDYVTQVVGTGHCVPFVQETAGAPQTALWRQGAKVRGADLLSGTAIATFENGRYANRSTGNHAAIYDRQDAKGLWVWHQYKGKPVHYYHINFRGGVGSPSNDGDAFYVIARP